MSVTIDNDVSIKIKHILFCLISVGLFMLAWQFYDELAHVKKSLFRIHLKHTIAMDEGTHLSLRPGMPMLTILIKRGLGLTWHTAFKATICIHIILTYWALRYVLTQFLGRNKSFLIIDFFALALMVAATIALPYLHVKVYNWAENSRSVLLWRNSTQTGLQPYAIIAFYALYRVFSLLRDHKTVSGTLLWVSNLALIASSLIKPSFSISFVPAFGLFTWFLLPRNYQTWRTVCLAIGPCALLLLAQYCIGFVYNPLTSTIKIIYSPWTVWTINNQYPLLSFLLSTAFPLSLIILRGKKLGALFYLPLTSFILALIPYILLAEAGEFADRNFEWSFWINLQILFLVSIVKWFEWRNEQVSRIKDKEFYLLYGTLVLFLLHAGSGFTKFIKSLTYII